jgi:flagellar biogenesis protein FliO
MGHYILNFSVYTMAMIGLIIFAVYVYKKFSISGLAPKRKGILKIEDALGLSPRKTLYIVRAGKEKFLIAADMDRTTLISKLDYTENSSNELDEIDKANFDLQSMN